MALHKYSISKVYNPTTFLKDAPNIYVKLPLPAHCKVDQTFLIMDEIMD